MLVENGSDVNASAKNGDTPLHMAAESGFPKIIELLIKNGLSPVKTYETLETGNI